MAAKGNTRTKVYLAELPLVRVAPRLSFEQVQQFVDLAAPRLGLSPVRVVRSYGNRSYAFASKTQPTIGLTASGLNVATVCHELAHLVQIAEDGTDHDHRRPFRSAHVWTVRRLLGVDAAEALVNAYADAGLDIDARAMVEMGTDPNPRSTK